ncbi:MAG TPA: GDP-mannose 4,6-dehydratase, partial [Pseudobdellovibrionaceae bacterium]|nr:GDP-mannose 4,6-dehydratase [Pseudobdellovibrionaceae bacterium]
MERALVTGGCGFIGSHLVDRLIAEDYEVVVIDNCSTGRLRNLDHLSSEARVKVILKDLNDQELDLKQIVSNVEVVYHLAALADIVPSIENPVGYFEANVTATMRLMEACRNQTNLRKIVYSASSSCYGIPSVYPTPETAEIKP